MVDAESSERIQSFKLAIGKKNALAKDAPLQTRCQLVPVQTREYENRVLFGEFDNLLGNLWY